MIMADKDAAFTYMLQNESKELEHKKIIPISENYYY
jgi:hypothetical protein